MKNKPSLIIATGGYASFIPLQIAKIFNVPYFLHEQNSFPGLVTRMFGSKAEKVFLGFENAKNYLKKSDILFTGNPIYNHSQKDISILLDHKKRTVLILGGSQGLDFHPISVRFFFYDLIIWRYLFDYDYKLDYL